MPFDGSRAELYRQSAERLRTKVTNAKAKEFFEQIARLYDMLATEVERPHIVLRLGQDMAGL